MRWATRPGIHIDRAASAWLIVTRIDPTAEFVYCSDVAAVPADTTPFDMFGCELGHHCGDCTFETILRRHDLSDRVLWRLAEIVHEADLEDGRFDAPEAPGLDVMVRALSYRLPDETVRATMHTVFDALEAYLRHEMLRPGR